MPSPVPPEGLFAQGPSWCCGDLSALGSAGLGSREMAEAPSQEDGATGGAGGGHEHPKPCPQASHQHPTSSQEVVFTLPKTETTPLCSPLPESKAPGHTRSVHLVPPVSYFRQYTGGGGVGWVARSWLLEQAGRGGEETQTLRESKAPSQMVQDKGSAQTGLGGEVLAGGERCFQDQPHGLLAFFFFFKLHNFLRPV